jgi:hypothetical protein
MLDEPGAPDDFFTQLDLSDAAHLVGDKVNKTLDTKYGCLTTSNLIMLFQASQVLATLQAISRRTQAFINAASTVSGIIGDLDTTILFATSGKLHAENKDEFFADHRKNILKTAKALVARARQGKGTVQVYDVIHPLPSLRNQESMIEHAFQAIQTNQPISGIKGPTTLHLIPNFDVARGMVPDIMHCLFLGIDNQFMKLWKTTRTGCYYVVNFCKKIDAFLSSISPPDDVP